MQWAGLVIVCAAVGCNHSHAVSDGSVASADSAPDSAAVAIDATIDAVPDAPPDASTCAYSAPPVDAMAAIASPACATAPTTLLDLGPARVANLVMLGETLFVATYTLDPLTGEVASGEVLAVDGVTGAKTSVLPVSATVSLANGSVYATDYVAGTIDRLVPGSAPMRVLDGHPNVGYVATDETDLYWTELNEIYGMPLCGGAITAVMSCTNPFQIALDATHVFCASLDGYIMQAGKDGSDPGPLTDGIADGMYPVDDVVRDGNALYYTNLNNAERLYKVPLPGGPEVVVAPIANPARLYGLALSDTFAYVAGDSGVYRVDKTTGQVTHLVTNELIEVAPVVGNGRLYYIGGDDSLIRVCVD